MPGLMTFSATRRWTGSACWAIQTDPMPPSPTSWISLYGPIGVRGRSVTGSSTGWGLAGLVHGQAREVAQLDDLRGDGIVGGQLRQGLIDGQELVRGDGSGQVDGVDVDPPELAAPLFTALFSGAIDQDAAHGLGRGGE